MPAMDDEIARARAKLQELGIGDARIDATPIDDWYLLATEHTLWGSAEPQYTVADVARMLDLDADTIRRWWMRLGFSDPQDRVVFRTNELETFRAAAAGLAFFGSDAIEHFIVMLGLSVRRIGEAATAMFPEMERGLPTTVLEAVEASAASAALFRMIPDQVLPTILLRAMEASIEFRDLTDAESGGQLSIGFCDLVGSTGLLNADDATPALAALAAFELFATEAALRHGGRVVKFVGDEVMFSAATGTDAINIGLELMQWVALHKTLESARVGIAVGDVIRRDGDVFGSTVNRAARLAEAAPPHHAWFDAAVSNDGDAITVSLRGFAEPIAIRAIRVTG